MTSQYTMNSSDFTIHPTDPPQHVSAIVPISCVAIAMVVFASLGYAYYKDLYIPKNGADPVETADFDFQSQGSRRGSIMYTQMIFFQVRHGLHTIVHFMGDTILSAGTALKTSSENWWRRKMRNETDTNTFHMGAQRWSYNREEEVNLI